VVGDGTVGRSNEISREICRVQDADDEPSREAAWDTAGSMAQALQGKIALWSGANLAISVTPEEAARQKSELS
jgi:hypothetical protein